MSMQQEELGPNPRLAEKRLQTASLSTSLLWAYPILFALAEIATVVLSAQAGLIAHGLVLVMLALHRALARDEAEQQLALTLLLVPLLRVLALALPLSRFPQATWLGLIALPMLMATWLVIRLLRIGPRELGLQSTDLPLQGMVAGGGLALGALAYALLRPAQIVDNLESPLLVLPVMTFVLCSGFTEELVFRGVLQATALRYMGRWALIYGALVFAVLQIGYRSPWYLLLALGTGLVFAYIAHWTGSIIGVALAHTLANFTLIFWMPVVTANPSSPIARLVPMTIILSALIGLSAFGYLLVRASGGLKLPRPAALPHPTAPLPDDKATAGSVTSGGSAAALLRTLRHDANLTIVGLAQICGVPARVVAEIELGLLPITPELLSEIGDRLQAASQQRMRASGVSS